MLAGAGRISGQQGADVATGEDPCPEHSATTQSSGFRYCFYIAHHGQGTTDDSQWDRNLSRDDEFSIFDQSDRFHLSDSKGHYYGLWILEEQILALGSCGEIIAKFWNPVKNQPTHGFPLWPLAATTPENRNQTVAPREALLKMEREGLLQPVQRKRLQKGEGRL